jgi:bifunctional non-homologous end joining protein LigD
MPLEEYRRKRRFEVTSEPAGSAKPRRKGRVLAYVIQKHRATALHYDFRLEWNDVLLSWAVPKGPSLDPAEKRLAMPTEDHPIEYAAFEGIIPAAEYGGGTVMIWDRGTWVPESPDVPAALKKGDLKFTLHGQKLNGSWVLVRTRAWKGSDRPSWLLIKHRDAFASAEGDVTLDQPRSVVSGRLLAEIAVDEGGDVEKAADGDPAEEVEKLLANPATLLRRKKKSKPDVWHSRPRAHTAPAPARPAAKGALPIAVSNPDKVFWPDEGYTKLHLVAFYAGVFPKLRPFVDDRLLSLERCPDGLLGQAFYQKEKPAGMPPDTPTKAIKHDRGVTNTVVGGKLETQLALANLGCIAVHVWGSRAQDLRRPDWVCFDLDPDSGLLSDAVKAALKVKAALDALELKSFVKTSGGKGLHIFVPIRVGPVTEEVLGFAQQLGTRLAAAYPKELTMEMRIAARKGRVFLDSFRNGYGQTVVTPFCVRRRPAAPVSTPLEWSEVTTSLVATDFNLGNFAERLKKPDPWARFFKSRQSLRPALEALKRL